MITMFAVVAFLLAMLGASELGRRIGVAQTRGDPDGLSKGIGAAEAAVFGLLGLLLAFTFSGAASRFEERRHLITEEANAIGTAYLRIDLLPSDAQSAMKELFRRYLDARLETYRNAEDTAATAASFAEDVGLHGDIWKLAVTETLRPGQMIDITSTRVMATRNHSPAVVFLMLAGLNLVGALLVG